MTTCFILCLTRGVVNVDLFVCIKSSISAVSRGLKSLSLFSNSRVLMELVSSRSCCVEVEGVLRDIQVLRESFVSISFSFMSRLCNSEADSIAKAALLSILCLLLAKLWFCLMNGLPPRKKINRWRGCFKDFGIGILYLVLWPTSMIFFLFFSFPTSMTPLMDSELIVVLEALWLIKWLELKDDWFMVLKIEQNTSHSC